MNNQIKQKIALNELDGGFDTALNKNWEPGDETRGIISNWDGIQFTGGQCAERSRARAESVPFTPNKDFDSTRFSLTG